LLDGLIESLPTARMLLLVNYRPEYTHGWGNKTYYRQLRIDPLPAESAHELLGALVGNDPALSALKRVLVERTAGNPLFPEESVRTLVETKVLVGDRGAYRLARASESFQIPATAQAILAARIDRLSPEDKRLLQAAAVIGKDVPFGLLHAIAELPDDVLRRGLGQLQAAEFLYEARLFPDLEYTFKHALTHDVTYRSLLHDRRRTLHRRIAETIEDRYPDRLAEPGENLALHASRGEVWDKAVAYCRQAAAKAMARAACREAVSKTEQAVSALAHLPETPDTLAQGIDVRIEMRHALWPLGDMEGILQHLEPAEKLAETLGDQRRLGQVISTKGYCFWMLGDAGPGLASGRRALTIAASLGDFALEAGANCAVGLAHFGFGQYAQAVQSLDAAIAVLSGERRYGRFATTGLTSVLCMFGLNLCQAELGSFAAGITSGEEGARIARAADHKISLMFADLGLGHLFLMQADLARAIPTLERGLEGCATWEFPLWAPWFGSRLGAAYVLAGRVADALPLLEHSMEQAEVKGWKADAAMLAARLGEGYLAADRIHDASGCSMRALDLAVK